MWTTPPRRLLRSTSVQSSGLANVLAHGINDAMNAEVMLRLTDAWSLFRNGTHVASAPGAFGSILVNGANWAIGARGAGDSRLFTGEIAKVAIYGEALSAARIQGYYFVGECGPPQLTLTISGGDVTLAWPTGTLQQADAVAGPYADVAASSPCTLPVRSTRTFYRLRL